MTNTNQDLKLNIKGQSHRVSVCYSLFRMRQVECSVDCLQNLFRKLQCCTYKALMTFMCNSNKAEMLFESYIFKEVKDKIWCKLVPTRPKCTFPIEFDDVSSKI